MIYDYPFKSQFLDISGNKLHYLDEGEGPAIMLLHGNPTWSYYYRHIIRELSKDFRIIAPDHIGCGLSDKPEPYRYTLARHIENITTLIDYLKLDTLSLVVHDWGGAIGMGYATKFTERIQRLVILNTAAFRSGKIPFRIRVCKLPVLGELIVRGLNGFAWPATFMAVRQKMAENVIASYLLPYNNYKNRVAIYNFVKDIPLSSKHPSYKTLVSIENNLYLLKENNIPILVIWGGKDFCFNDNFYQEWQNRFPDARYHYLKDAGHYILEDGHGVIEPIISDFFHEMLPGKC